MIGFALFLLSFLTNVLTFPLSLSPHPPPTSEKVANQISRITSIEYKTLLFTHKTRLIITITPVSLSVSVKKLSRLLSLNTSMTQSIKLLPEPELHPLTGCYKGTVPPHVAKLILQRGTYSPKYEFILVIKQNGVVDVVSDFEGDICRPVTAENSTAPPPPPSPSLPPPPPAPISPPVPLPQPLPSLPTILSLYRPFPDQSAFPELFMSLTKSPHPTLSLDTFLVYLHHLHSTESLTIPLPTILLAPTDSSHKSAIHLVFWKHPISTLRRVLSLATACNCLPSVLECESKGRGNYGKTALHYAITQNRNDVTQMLLLAGASALIVNNKGQTARSMCPGHLDAETTGMLIARESEQLRLNEPWRNFRATHPDHDKRYGDLDSRFLDGNSDPDGTLADSSEQFEAKHGRLPEVVMGTSIESRKRINMRVVEGGEKFVDKKLLETQLKNNVVPSTATTKKRRQREAELKLQLQSKLQKDLLLTYPKVTVATLPSDVITLIDSSTLPTSLPILQQAIADCPVFGLDCEWKPTKRAGQESPVATLQLSCESNNFIVDLQSLFRPFLPANTPLTASEKRISDVIATLFSSNCTVLGFGMAQDLLKLAASFPHVPGFRRHANLVDLQTHSVQSIRTQFVKAMVASLQKLVGVLLEIRMDKDEQCSDWTLRPLTSTQCSYACIDAGILLRVYSALGESDDTGSMALTVVDERPGWFVPEGSIATSCGLRMAKQFWRGGDKNEPGPPVWDEGKAVVEGEKLARRAENRERQVQQEEDRREESEEKMRVNIMELEMGGAIRAGEVCGKGKKEALTRLVGGVPAGSVMEFSTRGGVVHFKGGCALFVNLGVSRSAKWRNEMTSDSVSFQHVGREPAGEIVMFARDTGEMVFLGRLREASREGKNVVYELLDREALAGSEEYGEIMNLAR